VGNTTKVVLITGASSGFGSAIAKALAARGYRAFGTARAPRAGTCDAFTTLALDVTQDESVAACIANALRPFLPHAVAAYLSDAYGLK
jgi:NADP-dependent 3-hydroxy acid dehydrogenase YdfG